MSPPLLRARNPRVCGRCPVWSRGHQARHRYLCTVMINTQYTVRDLVNDLQTSLNSNMETTCLIVYTAVWQTFFILYHMNYKSCFQQEGAFSEYCDEIITILLLSKLKSPSVETVECVRGNSANLMNPDWNSGWRLRGFLCSLHPSHRDTVHFIQCPVSGHCIN